MNRDSATAVYCEPEDSGLVSQLVSEHREGLRRFLLRRLGHVQEAEDALQETCLRLLAYRAREAISVEAPQALVFRIAENVLADRHRRRSVRRADAHCDLEGVDLVSTEPSQERQVVAQQEVLLLREAIQALPPKCKQAFLLSRLRRLSYPQIAEQMGISVKMVEKHITHALALCRQKVGRVPP